MLSASSNSHARRPTTSRRRRGDDDDGPPTHARARESRVSDGARRAPPRGRGGGGVFWRGARASPPPPPPPPHRVSARHLVERRTRLLAQRLARLAEPVRAHILAAEHERGAVALHVSFLFGVLRRALGLRCTHAERDELRAPVSHETRLASAHLEGHHRRARHRATAGGLALQPPRRGGSPHRVAAVTERWLGSRLTAATGHTVLSCDRHT